MTASAVESIETASYPRFNSCMLLSISSLFLLPNLNCTYSAVHSPIQSDINSNTEGSRLSSTVHYPMFDLCMPMIFCRDYHTHHVPLDPAVYPHSLNQIYPTQLESIILDRKTDGTMPIDKCSPLEPGKSLASLFIFLLIKLRRDRQMSSQSRDLFPSTAAPAYRPSYTKFIFKYNEP